jgi:TonB family protein
MIVHASLPTSTADTSRFRGAPLRALLRSLCVLCVLCGVGPAAAQEIKQAGTDVPAPKRTRFVAPVYPPEAQATGQRGIVILELVVDVSGKVGQVTVVRSVPPFDEAALAAVRQWEYEVTKVDGKPVPVRLTVPITFALKIPTVSRASGVPELRMGAAPALPPQPWSVKDATVEAEVTIDPDGQVTDALVTVGDSPWAEALLQALRTWRFAANPAEGPMSFKTTARFSTDGGQGKVDLELSDPRSAVAAAAPAPPEAAAATPASAPAPASPAAPPPTMTAATVPDAPVSTASPVATPPTPSASPAPATAPAKPRAAPGTATASTTPQAPIEEVVPAAPPPPPPPEGGGGSAVRGIQLGEGVPDLVSGRRPVVPPLARLNTVTGKVLVRFAVDASGSTSAVEAEGQDSLREAARQAVASWIFRRTKADRLRLAAEFDYGAESATASVGLESAAR